MLLGFRGHMWASTGFLDTYGHGRWNIGLILGHNVLAYVLEEFFYEVSMIP